MKSDAKPAIVCIVGPTASGKSARAIAIAKERNGEIISVDSRQVYRSLDIGTEKIRTDEMSGIPHHLIDIREPEESYSAGEFVADADRLIEDMISRGVTPILAGGSHFYFDALLYGLPGDVPDDAALRAALEARSSEDLFSEIEKRDPRRANMLDPQNRRRLIRTLEIIEKYGYVPERTHDNARYTVEWIVINPERDELRARIDARLKVALESGLIEEVRATRERVGDERLIELGLEYSVVGEYLRGERDYDSLLPALSSRLWHYARRQKAWLRKLELT